MHISGEKRNAIERRGEGTSRTKEGESLEREKTYIKNRNMDRG